MSIIQQITKNIFSRNIHIGSRVNRASQSTPSICTFTMQASVRALDTLATSFCSVSVMWNAKLLSFSSSSCSSARSWLPSFCLTSGRLQNGFSSCTCCRDGLSRGSWRSMRSIPLCRSWNTCEGCWYVNRPLHLQQLDHSINASRWPRSQNSGSTRRSRRMRVGLLLLMHSRAVAILITSWYSMMSAAGLAHHAVRQSREELIFESAIHVGVKVTLHRRSLQAVDEVLHRFLGLLPTLVNRYIAVTEDTAGL